MLSSADLSCLMVVDIQSRLLPAMHSAAEVVANGRILLRAAELLEVPVLASEQYTKGLGATVPEIAALVPEGATLEKIHFSCAADAGLALRLGETGRRQCVVCGIEAHVCVLQTCVHLLEQGHQVFVVADATSSRTSRNHQLALDRLRATGAEIVSTEMIVFEWLHRADADTFRDLSRLIK